MHVEPGLATRLGEQPRAHQMTDAQQVLDIDEDARGTATPTTLLGDQRSEGAVPLTEFRAALDKVLAGAR